jgi:alkaline phosphatase
MLWLLLVLILSAWTLPSWAAQARNVILMIGDGMGPAHVELAWLYATRQLHRPLVMTEVMDAGRTAYMVNDTADTTVTESAAAATQMATGVKVTAKAIGMGPDGKVLKTILEMAREKGKATGLVTTSGITDATPAAFAAHVDHRSNEVGIAEQLVKSNINVLFGGRKEFFLPEAEKGRRKDGRNLIDEARKEGYTVVQTAEEMDRAEAMKLLGLFNGKNMLFEIDRKGSPEPSLADMTTKALDVLNRNGDGFFLMVEGGRIDHAAHHHDVGAMLRDTLAFDEAVARAYDFQKAHPDTLLIITADHETGGFIVLPYSPTGTEYEGVNLEALSKIKASYEKRDAEFGKDPSAEKIREVIRAYYDVELTPDQAQAIRENALKKYDPRHFQYNRDGTIAFFLRLHHRIGWATDSHSATPLFLWGIGPGSEPIHGWRHNTEVFRIIRDAYGF